MPSLRRWPIAPTSPTYTLLLGAISALPPLGIDMILPALPRIATDFQTDPATAGAALSLFLLGFAVAPLMFGMISDRVGRRPLLLLGIALFVIASLACAFSPSITWMLVVRLMQGMGAGVGAAMPLAIIRDVYDEHAARTRLSMVTLVLSVAPLIAPALGSAVLPFGGWRWIYGALGIASLVLLLFIFPSFEETLKQNARQTLGLRQLATRYRSVLCHPIILKFSLVNALSFAAMFAYIAGSPLVFIRMLGLSPAAFSGAFAFAGLGVIAGSFINGKLAHRGVSSSRLLCFGLILGAIATIAFAALSVTNHIGLATMLPLLVLSNAAYGFVAPNAVHDALHPIPEAVGIASAVLRCVQMVAGTAASALVPIIYGRHPNLAMGGVMAACSVAALAVYLFTSQQGPGLRHARQVPESC